MNIIGTLIIDMKILIVDDDESLTAIISTALEKEGFTALTCATGRDATNRIKKTCPIWCFSIRSFLTFQAT